VAVAGPDSGSYVRNRLRPPGYPWFISAVRGGGGFHADEQPGNDQPLTSPSPAILNVVRAQKIIFYATVLCAAACFSLVAPPGLAVAFFYTLFHFNWLLAFWESYLMSELLASSLTMLILGLFFLALARRSLWLLPLLALALTGAILTRTGAGFAIVLVAVATVVVVLPAVAARRWQPLAWSLGSALLIGLVGFGAACLNCYQCNGYWALAPLKNFERMAFALEVADPGDADLFSDPEKRRFLADALRRRTEALEDPRHQSCPFGPFDLNVNCWQASMPAALAILDARRGDETANSNRAVRGSLFLDRTADGLAFVNRLLGETADVLLAHHRERYSVIVSQSFFHDAVYHTTRLKLPHLSFLYLAAACLVCCFLDRGRLGIAGLSCLLSHVVALVGICTYELALPRYLQFSEWLALLGFFCGGLAGFGFLARCTERAWLRLRPASTPAVASPAVAACPHSGRSE
jgi:hypothetical protein